jgi:hypothetical protein
VDRVSSINRDRQNLSTGMRHLFAAITERWLSVNWPGHSRPCFRSLPPPWPGRFSQGRLRVYVHHAAPRVRLPYGHRRP